MKIKDKTYYKKTYVKNVYNIWYIDNGYAYLVVTQMGKMTKNTHNKIWGNLKRWNTAINTDKYTLEEISEADVFLELL